MRRVEVAQSVSPRGHYGGPFVLGIRRKLFDVYLIQKTFSWRWTGRASGVTLPSVALTHEPCRRNGLGLQTRFAVIFAFVQE